MFAFMIIREPQPILFYDDKKLFFFTTKIHFLYRDESGIFVAFNQTFNY